MANELFHESVPVILHDDDLNAMYFSVENRSPYLDTDLFDWSQQIPTRHLVRNGRAKAVLRDAVRGLVPDAVIDNPRKVGFNAPLLDYLDTRSNAVRAASSCPTARSSTSCAATPSSRCSSAPSCPTARASSCSTSSTARLFLEEFAS